MKLFWGSIFFLIKYTVSIIGVLSYPLHHQRLKKVLMFDRFMCALVEIIIIIL